MAKLIISNNKCKLQNASLTAVRELTDRLSFKDPNASFSPTFRSGRWDGTIKFFTRPANSFDTGLLPLVVEVLKEIQEQVMVEDLRTGSIKPQSIDEDFVMGEKRLRDYQGSSVNDAINNKCGNIPFIRGIINIATNGGKTVISEAIMKQILPFLTDGKKVLFLTHSKEIAYQSKESIEKDLGLSVGLIGDGKWEEQVITVCLVPTLAKNLKADKFKKLAKNVIGIVADECHHATADTWAKVIKAMDNTYIRIGLTGTIPGADIPKHKLFGLIGPPIVKISNDYLIKEEHSAKPICYFTKIHYPDIEGSDYQTAYSLGIVENPYRNELITKICTTEVHKNHRVLILVERTEHGEILMDKLNTGEFKVDFTHGKRGSKDRQNLLACLKSGTIDVLIATSVLDEGVDTDNLNAIIYARGMKSPRKLLQGIGRTLRKKKDGSSVAVYDFIDFTHPDLTEHSLNRFETVENEGFEIKELVL
jgi:superfamily II DNA or RNA helicase